MFNSLIPIFSHRPQAMQFAIRPVRPCWNIFVDVVQLWYPGLQVTLPGTMIYLDNAIPRYFLLSSFWIYIILRELVESQRYVDIFAKLSSPLFIRLNRCPTVCLNLLGFWLFWAYQYLKAKEVHLSMSLRHDPRLVRRNIPCWASEIRDASLPRRVCAMKHLPMERLQPRQQEPKLPRTSLCSFWG